MKTEEKVANLLKEKSLTIATAESCTGGLIANRLTNIEGASKYFMAGFVTYSNKSKSDFLNVPDELITEKGAVSYEVAYKMAEGVRNAVGVDIGISSTGIAGPSGGTKEKPVGTVYIGISAKEGTFVRKLALKGSRIEIKRKTSSEVLNLIIDYLEGRLK